MMFLGKAGTCLYLPLPKPFQQIQGQLTTAMFKAQSDLGSRSVCYMEHILLEQRW